MSKKLSNSGQNRMIRLIESKGFSRRQSERAFKAVFDCMAAALRRGEIVEIPGGQAQVVKSRPLRRLKQWHNIATRKSRYRVITQIRLPLDVQFRSDPNFF